MIFTIIARSLPLLWPESIDQSLCLPLSAGRSNAAVSILIPLCKNEGWVSFLCLESVSWIQRGCICVYICIFDSCTQGCARISVQVWKLLSHLCSLFHTHRAWFQNSIQPCTPLCKNDYPQDQTSWLQCLPMTIAGLCFSVRCRGLFMVEREPPFPTVGDCWLKYVLCSLEEGWVHVSNDCFLNAESDYENHEFNPLCRFVTNL